jgi:hypothetical protein
LIVGMTGEMPLRPDCPRFSHVGNSKAIVFIASVYFFPFLPPDKGNLPP